MGNEKHTDQAIVSKKGSFHVYYFTLAGTTRISWKTAIKDRQF
jgi:hypothetical protein